MSDGVDALVERDPFVAASGCEAGKAPRRIVGRRYRILREGVQDVGQHQFLMLLLVIEADFHQRRELASVSSSAVWKNFTTAASTCRR